MLKKATRIINLCAFLLLLRAMAVAADSRVQVPFEYAKNVNSILLHVCVNGKPALLILDTGSAYTVLRPEFLGLSPGDLQTSHRSSSGAGFSGDAVGREVSLELGSRKWPKSRVAVMDLSEILSVYSESIDGVLGLDFLQQFRSVVFNFEEKTITFGNSQLAAESELLAPRRAGPGEKVARPSMIFLLPSTRAHLHSKSSI